MTGSGERLAFKNNSKVFTSSVETNSARKCAQIETRPRQTFHCSCFPLFEPSTSGVYTFFGNGDEEFLRDAPPTAEEQEDDFQQPNISVHTQLHTETKPPTVSPTLLLVGAFLKKRVDYSYGSSSVFFFGTPEVTKIILPEVLQNFKL